MCQKRQMTLTANGVKMTLTVNLVIMNLELLQKNLIQMISLFLDQACHSFLSITRYKK